MKNIAIPTLLLTLTMIFSSCNDHSYSEHDVKEAIDAHDDLVEILEVRDDRVEMLEAQIAGHVHNDSIMDFYHEIIVAKRDSSLKQCQNTWGEKDAEAHSIRMNEINAALDLLVRSEFD